MAIHFSSKVSVQIAEWIRRRSIHPPWGSSIYQWFYRRIFFFQAQPIKNCNNSWWPYWI